MCVKQTHKYLQMCLIHLMHQNTKVPLKLNKSPKNMTLLVNMGSTLLRLDPTVGGEQRESCVATDKIEGGGLGATVAIAAILFHRLSFIKPDKLLKELLSECCWYAARKQPSVSVSKSITLLSCAREEEEEEDWGWWGVGGRQI